MYKQKNYPKKLKRIIKRVDQKFFTKLAQLKTRLRGSYFQKVDFIAGAVSMSVKSHSFINIIANEQPFYIYMRRKEPSPHSPASLPQDYQHTVLAGNTRSLITCTLITYFLYVLLSIVAFCVAAQRVSSYERKYIVDLEMALRVGRRAGMDGAVGFVDRFREIMGVGVTGGAGEACRDDWYECQGSCFGQVVSFIGGKYGIFQVLYEGLVQQAQHADSQIFMFSPPSPNPYLFFKFPDMGSTKYSRLLEPYIRQQTSDSYLIRVIRIFTSTDSYKVKLLICGKATATSKICILTAGNLQQPLPEKTNPIRVIDQEMITITLQNSTFENTMTYLQEESQIVMETVGDSVALVDRDFFLSFNYSECIEKHSKIQSLVKKKVRVCNPSQILYFLAPLTIFSSFQIQLPSRYYVEDMTLTSRLQQVDIKFLIFSNRTFFAQELHRSELLHQRQAFFMQGMVLVVVLWLMLMPVLPLRLVDGDLSETVNILMDMCKTVREIRNKDDLETQVEAFSKLNMRLAKKKHVFGTTVDYFKYFIWYRKWLYFTSMAKRKALLGEGLELFGTSEYAPVLMYIYKKEIDRDIKLASNYKKIRKIFMQKFIVLNEEKIEASITNIKSRAGARKFKKSGFIKEETDTDRIEKRDYCMIENMDKDFETRINKQLDMMEAKKNKRYVRFSNDLQEEDKPLQYRVSKFLLNNPSQSSILKSSQKSIEEEIRKKEEEDAGSSPMVESSREERVLDLDNQSTEKNEENWDINLKFDQLDDNSDGDDNEEQFFELKQYSLKKIDQKLGPTYENIVSTYTAMIAIKKAQISQQPPIDLPDYINELYSMLIERLRYMYKHTKHKNKQRENMIKHLSRKLIDLKNDKRGGRLINKTEAQDKLWGSQKWLQDTISVIEEEIQDEAHFLDVEYGQFTELEEAYAISSSLLERGRLYQIKMLKILGYPIPYKKLQALCESTSEQIRVQARVIMAAEFFHISPHADYDILQRAQEILTEPQTTCSQKQKTLELVKRVLRNRELLEEEETQIESIKNYYNYVHKKFYFVADLSDNYQTLRGPLMEIYKYMGQVDMYQIMNLAMNEVVQDMIVTGSEIKPPKFADFEAKFQSLYQETTRIKSLASTKTGNRRLTFEKDFNKILGKIEVEDISLSKFVVLVVGGENQSQSKSNEQYESSSAQNRQVFQMVHQEILSKIDRNYFHFVLVGFNLRDSQGREAKIKRYIRHTYDYIEIDLSRPKIDEQYKQLAKFLTK